MRRAICLIFGLILLGLGGHVVAAPAEKFFHTPYSTESQYLESSILRDIAGMLLKASPDKPTVVEVTAKVEGDGSASYRLTLAGMHVDIALPQHQPMWEPARYQDAVTSIAATLRLPASHRTGPVSSNLLHELENPSIETLTRASAQISEQLKNDMRASGPHEAAAALLASFALQERLEPFDDIRWALNRLTAHLAVAQWTGDGKPGREGHYALATVYALMNLQTSALAKIRELEKLPDANPVWNRVLQARVTGDPRRLATGDPKAISPFEWEERIYALHRSSGSEAAGAEAQRYVKAMGTNLVDGSDLFFCVFAGQGLPGELPSHMWDPADAMTLVQYNAKDAWRFINHTKADPPATAEWLNIEPAGCVQADGRIEVIDWGAWAMQTQRQLETIYVRTLEFLQRQQGKTPAELAQADEQMKKTVGGLWLTPCFGVERAGAGNLNAAWAMFAERPQILPTATVRNLLLRWATERVIGNVGKKLDDEVRIFNVAFAWPACLPSGTLLGLASSPALEGKPAALRDLLQTAPYSVPLIRQFLQQGNPGPVEAASVLQPIAEFNTYASETLSRTLTHRETAPTTARN